MLCFFWLTGHSSLNSPDFMAMLLMVQQTEQQKVLSAPSHYARYFQSNYFQLFVETSEQWLVSQISSFEWNG